MNYIREIHILSTELAERTAYRDESLDKISVPSFAYRLKKYEDLERDFFKSLCLTDILYRQDNWGLDRKDETEDDNEESLVCAITEAICHFFYSLGYAETDTDYLVCRVRWALRYPAKTHISFENKKILEKMRPVFLLIMVLACERNVFHDMSSTDISPNRVRKKKPLFFERISGARQRLAQLMLLNKFFNVFDSSFEDRVDNWKEYICLQGNEILSREELSYWRHCLKGKYSLIPQIGFLLCFLNYCEQCAPPHYQSLSYRNASELHINGYASFYKKRKHQLRKLSTDLFENGKNKEIIRKYRKLWNNPVLTNIDKMKEISALMIKFPDISVEIDKFLCAIIPKRDLEYYLELKRLVFETVVQMSIRRSAVQKLVKSFSREYRVTLKVSAKDRVKFFDQIEPRKPLPSGME